MPFAPPLDLMIKTYELRADYSIYLGRYFTYFGSDKNRLQHLITQIDTHVSCCPTKDRADERDSLVQMRNEASTSMSSSPDVLENATYLLLGGLIHRKIRIEKWYEQTKYKVYTLFATHSPENSNLYKAINSALSIDRDNFICTGKNPPDKTKKNELRLDEVTIVLALEVFRNNMLSIEGLKGSDGKLSGTTAKKYKNYPHLNNDVNFETYLDEMIAEYREKGAFLLKQFQAITFLEKFSAQIEADKKVFAEELGQWCTALKTSHKTCATLTTTRLKEHTEKYFSAKSEQEQAEKKYIKAELLYILSTDYIADALLTEQLVSWCKCLKPLDSKSITGDFLVQHFQAQFAENPNKEGIYQELRKRFVRNNDDHKEYLLNFYKGPIFGAMAEQKEFDFSMLADMLKQSNAQISDFTLCGAYLFLLDCGTLGKDLNTYLMSALGLTEKLSDSETLHYADFLHTYLKRECATKLYDEFFGSISNARTKIANWILPMKQQNVCENEQQELVREDSLGFGM